MNEYILGAFLFLSAAFIPKSSRATIAGFFNGSTISQPAENAGSSMDSVLETSGTDSFPKDRTLTAEEVMQLAHHVSETYSIHATSAQDLTVFAYIESSFRPWVVRDEGFDKSTGLMQTLLGTANDMYNKGYKAMGRPTHERLKDPVVSMYFGAAYLQWLKHNYSTWGYEYGDWEAFFIRAYNGGAGWQKTKNGAKNTAAYLAKWQAAKQKLNLPSIIFTGA